MRNNYFQQASKLASKYGTVKIVTLNEIIDKAFESPSKEEINRELESHSKEEWNRQCAIFNDTIKECIEHCKKNGERLKADVMQCVMTAAIYNNVSTTTIWDAYLKWIMGNVQYRKYYLNAHDFVVVKSIRDNHLVVSENN